MRSTAAMTWEGCFLGSLSARQRGDYCQEKGTGPTCRRPSIRAMASITTDTTQRARQKGRRQMAGHFIRKFRPHYRTICSIARRSTTHPTAHPHLYSWYAISAGGLREVLDFYGAPGVIRTPEYLCKKIQFKHQKYAHGWVTGRAVFTGKWTVGFAQQGKAALPGRSARAGIGLSRLGARCRFGSRHLTPSTRQSGG